MNDNAGWIRSVTVYCSASESLHESYYDVARELGEGLARSGRKLVYGGGSVGMMGRLARACRDAGGHVTGIITERLRLAEQLDTKNQENIIVSTMRERKALLEANGDAIVVLPGGLGTLEEFFEILVGRLLGEHDKPIILLNADDPNDQRRASDRYYDPLLSMFDHLIENRFAQPGVRELFDVCDSPASALAALDLYAAQSPSGAIDRSHLMPTAARPAAMQRNA